MIVVLFMALSCLLEYPGTVLGHKPAYAGDIIPKVTKKIHNMIDKHRTASSKVKCDAIFSLKEAWTGSDEAVRWIVNYIHKRKDSPDMFLRRDAYLSLTDYMPRMVHKNNKTFYKVSWWYFIK